jgi:PAS domain S-box-containing protein
VADRFQTASGILAAIVVLVGFGVILGWLLEIEALKTVFPNFSPMPPSTAVALLVSGAALWIYQRPGVTAWRGRTLTALAALAGGLGLLTLVEQLGGFSLGVDRLFGTSAAADAASGALPMTLSMAAALLLFNGAMVLADRTDRLGVPNLLAISAATLTGLSAIGDIFGQSLLTGVLEKAEMAPHTSWSMLALCAGFLLAHPSSAIMRVVSDEGPAGFVVRRLLPAAFVLPVLLGFIWWQGQERAWYSPAFTMTLFVSSTIAALAFIVWLAGNLVQGLDARRQSAEQQRMQTEERLRRAVAEAPVPMIIHDDADRILHMSQGWTNLSGYTIADAPTISQWITVAQQATRPEVEAYVRRISSSDRTIHGGEVAIRTKAGGQRYWEFSTTPLGRMADGRPSFLTLAIDITERRQSEAELRQLNEQLEQRIAERTDALTRANESLQRQSAQLQEQAALLDLASDGIIVRDLAGTIVYWSAGATSMFGYGRDEALGRNAGQLLKKTFSESREHVEREVLAVGHWEGEVSMTRKDGSTITVESSWTLTKSGRDEAQGFLEIHRDVTARRMAAESLRESELRFRAVAETAAVGVVMADEQGTIRYWNPGAETMFGWMEEDALGQPLTILMPERFRAGHDAGLKRYLATRESRMLGRAMEMAGLRQDGTEFPLELSISSWRTSKGTFFSAFLRDITARKDAEQVLRAQAQELARSNQELEQFAYVASHDLQEPLRMVSNYTQLLASRYRDRLDGDALEFIDFAVDGAKRMQALIHDLLQYARVGTRGKEFRPTAGREILDSAIANLSGAIKETQAEVRLDDLPTIRCDGTQLAQVFQNLIGNALKFRRPDARPIVHVSATPEDGAWRFSVSDNGIGIEQKYFDRIFQMFQRLHGRDQYEGTGIGLALCRKIVERHGGRIFVESQPGRGTTFSFTIPDPAVRAARAS